MQLMFRYFGNTTNLFFFVLNIDRPLDTEVCYVFFSCVCKMGLSLDLFHIVFVLIFSDSC